MDKKRKKLIEDIESILEGKTESGFARRKYPIGTKLAQFPISILSTLLDDPDNELKEIEDAISHYRGSGKTHYKKSRIIRKIEHKFINKETRPQAIELLKSYTPKQKKRYDVKYMDEFEKMFNDLVPPSGHAETKKGEIARAMMRALYRWYNDGDTLLEHSEAAVLAGNYLERHVPGASPLVKRCRVPYSTPSNSINGRINYSNNLHKLLDHVYEYLITMDATIPNDKCFMDIPKQPHFWY